MTEATDTNDPRAVAEHRWGHAIARWQAGDVGPLAALIADLNIPVFAREFLTDLAAGKAARRGGRPPEHTAAAERELVYEVMREWDHGTSESARAAVAERYGLSEEQVRGIVDKARAAGLTREIWQLHLLPAEQAQRSRRP